MAPGFSEEKGQEEDLVLSETNTVQPEKTCNREQDKIHRALHQSSQVLELLNGKEYRPEPVSRTPLTPQVSGCGQQRAMLPHENTALSGLHCNSSYGHTRAIERESCDTL
ncbi:unnamed protein product [Boreogadus saida]